MLKFFVFVIGLFFLFTGCSPTQENTPSVVVLGENVTLLSQKTLESQQKLNLTELEQEAVPEVNSGLSADISCSECHFDECRKWSGSFHRHAMNDATAKNVLGNFLQKEHHHIAFDELIALTNDEVQMVVDEMLKGETTTISPLAGTLEPSTFVQWAIALSDVSPAVIKKLRDALGPANSLLIDSETDFLQRCGPIRPDVIAKYQVAIVDVVLKLLADGKIQTPLGMTFGLDYMGDAFQMTLDGKEGQTKTFPIKYVLGVYPLQQYLVEFEDGRIQCLPLAWNTRDHQWFSLYPGERILFDDPLHWTRPLQNWNQMCADCHTTGYEKNFDPDKNQFSSRWNEMGVGCAACHTGSAEHERSARLALEQLTSESTSSKVSPAPLPAALSEKGKAEDLSTLEDQHRQQSIFTKRLLSRSGLLSTPPSLTENHHGVELIESCAPCHSRRHNLAKTIKPGGAKYSDYHVPERIGTNVYYADGQLKEESFEYTSFCQSRMSAMGVRCSDCHDSHSLELKKPGNQLCAQCHRVDYYDSPNHHHHQTVAVELPTTIERFSKSILQVPYLTEDAGGTPAFPVPLPLPVKMPSQLTQTQGPGMNCVDCHLPAMNFMVVDRRYDHNIHIPRPQMTLDLGTPNACNLCHYNRDKREDAAWAQSWIEQWYKPEETLVRGRLNPGEHYGYAISAGMKDSPEGLPLLEKVFRQRDTAKVRDIVRASALDLIARYNSEHAGPFEKEVFSLLIEGLTDENDWVRRAAVAGFESFSLNEQAEQLFPLLNDPSRAVRSEVARLLASSDTSPLNNIQKSDLKRVLDEYREELAVNADQGASWLNLGVLEQNLRQTEQNKFAMTFEQLLTEVGPAHPLTAAARAELMRKQFETTQKGVDAYLKGIAICPDFFPLRINLAMLYYQRNQMDKAEIQFREAIRIDAQQGEAHYSLALLLAETGRIEGAAEEFQKATELLPHRYRVFYNYALALNQIGQTDQALVILQRAIELEPTSSECLKAIELFKNSIELKKE